MKKIVSMFLALIMLLSMSVTAFAEEDTSSPLVFEDDGVEVTVQDNEFTNEFIVTVEYDDRYEVATRNNSTYEIVTQVFDWDGHLLNEFTTDASVMLNLGNIPMVANYYQHTFSNYEYDVDTSGTYEVWTCTRNRDIKTRTKIPNTTTAERLIQWEYFVDEINDIELDLILETGVSIASFVITELLTGGLATALAYLEGSVGVIEIMIDLDEAQGNADEVFNRL